MRKSPYFSFMFNRPYTLPSLEDGAMKKEKEILKYEKPALNRLDAGVKGQGPYCNPGYGAGLFCNEGSAAGSVIPGS